MESDRYHESASFTRSSKVEQVSPLAARVQHFAKREDAGGQVTRITRLIKDMTDVKRRDVPLARLETPTGVPALTVVFKRERSTRRLASTVYIYRKWGGERALSDDREPGIDYESSCNYSTATNSRVSDLFNPARTAPPALSAAAEITLARSFSSTFLLPLGRT